MTTPSRGRWISPILALAVILASCGGSDESSTASTVPAETLTETTLAGEPVPTTEAASTVEEPDSDATVADPDDQDPDSDDIDGVPDDDVPDVDVPDDGLPGGDWRSSPLADVVLHPAAIEAAIGGSWTPETPVLTEPEESTGTTCGAADPASFDGIQAAYFDETNDLELAQIIQVGEGVDVWIAAFEALPNCSDAGEDDVDVDLVDIEVEGADNSVVIFSFNGSDEGYASGGAAMRGNVVVGLIAFSETGGDNLPSPEAIAELLSSTLGEAVVLANTEPVGTSPAMALTEADLADAGLGDDFERIGLDEFQADASLAWDGEECSLVDSGAFDGFTTELVGPLGDPRIAQLVSTGPDVGVWIESFAAQPACDGQGAIPVVRADVWVQGAQDAVVLSPNGTDSDGTSYAVAVGVVDDMAVVVIVFADTPDDPALDSRVVSELAAIALARR